MTPPHLPSSNLAFGYGPSINAKIPLNLTYSYYTDIRIKGIEPRWGPIEGSTQVTILGEHFLNISTLRVKIGESDPVAPHFISSTELRITTSAFRTHGTKLVEVSNNNYDFSSFSEVYLRVYKCLVITKIEPPLVSSAYTGAL